MAVICPTVTVETNDPHAYRTQLERVTAFAPRIHIDLMDGILAPTKSINPVQLWWPDEVIADIHLMFQRPSEHLETLVALSPSLVIFHAEADGDIGGLMGHLKRFGIRSGIAFLQHTQVDRHEELVRLADHVLIFGGRLGHFGGTAELSLLQKVKDVRSINPGVEVGWDGGVNDTNVSQLVQGGIDVLDVGGFIQRSDRPQKAYDLLVSHL